MTIGMSSLSSSESQRSGIAVALKQLQTWTKNLSCTKCDKAEETQRHLLECEALSSNSVVTSLPVYEDLFGCDHDKIRSIGVILSEKFTLFKLKPSAPSSLQLCAAGGSNQQPAGDLSSV